MCAPSIVRVCALLHSEETRDYPMTFVFSIYSFTQFVVHGSSLTMTQIGEELNNITVTKA